MKIYFLFLVFFLSTIVEGQELFVNSEPASNMPAHSVSIRLTGKFMSGQQRFMQRYSPVVMFGINKNWMLHLGGTVADMHTSKLRGESIYFYGKYRFLSHDEIHEHFRMAVFADASYSRSRFEFDELSLEGDKSGVQLGLIATQLWNKLALSATGSFTQSLDKSRNDKVVYDPARIYQSFNYSFSSGYLVLPFEYVDYRQTNLNVYLEVLGQHALDRKGYFADLAPSVQWIFNSNTKVNLGYRFQLGGNMQRLGTSSWQVSIERTFLNALKK